MRLFFGPESPLHWPHSKLASGLHLGYRLSVSHFITIGLHWWLVKLVKFFFMFSHIICYRVDFWWIKVFTSRSDSEFNACRQTAAVEVKSRLTWVTNDGDQHEHHRQCWRDGCSERLMMTLPTKSLQLIAASSVNRTHADSRTCRSWRHRGYWWATTWHLLSATGDEAHAVSVLAAAAVAALCEVHCCWSSSARVNDDAYMRLSSQMKHLTHSQTKHEPRAGLTWQTPLDTLFTATGIDKGGSKWQSRCLFWNVNIWSFWRWNLGILFSSYRQRRSDCYMRGARYVTEKL